jgi:hypothetical protein
MICAKCHEGHHHGEEPGAKDNMIHFCQCRACRTGRVILRFLLRMG